MLQDIANKISKSQTDQSNITLYPKSDIIPHFSKLQSYINLQQNLKYIQNIAPAELHNGIDERQKKYTLHAANIEFNYSLQPINDVTVQNLCKLADDFNLKQYIEKLFSGEKVNVSENRPALHTALRAYEDETLYLNDRNIIHDVITARNKTLKIAESIRQNKWFTNLDKKVTDVVNVGIGGSELGPKMAIYALQEYKNTDIKHHFLSNNDPKYFKRLLNKINVNSTVFIINSKSFTTKETITNLQLILNLIDDSLPISEHIIAITSNFSLARSYNIKHILPIWDWVGGRFSFCSSVNLILAIMIGSQNFLSILNGAKSMDYHFRNTPYYANIPVISALLEIWNINFFKSNSHLMLTYVDFLNYLPDFLQQLEMESNGKSTNVDDYLINYTTSSIIWGGLGNHAEHAYYQFLIQGSYFNTIDYFFTKEAECHSINYTAYTKIELLAKGLGNPDYKRFRLGINLINLEKLTPETLGSLVAMYEHKAYCQSVLWNINAFDQPGVAIVKNAIS